MDQLSIVLHTLTSQPLLSFGSSIACQRRLQCRFASLGNKIDYHVEPQHCDIRNKDLFAHRLSAVVLWTLTAGRVSTCYVASE